MMIAYDSLLLPEKVRVTVFAELVEHKPVSNLTLKWFKAEIPTLITKALLRSSNLNSFFNSHYSRKKYA